MFSHGLSIANPPPPAERPVTHAPRCLCFFSVYLFVTFLRGAFSPPSHRSDPTAASLSISTPGPCVFLLLPSLSPSQSLVHRNTPRPFSFATQPAVSPIDGQIHTRYSNQSPVNDAMAKPTHARGHIYSLAEVAKRKSLSSSAIHCRLMPA